MLIKIPYSRGALGKNNGCEKAPDEIVRFLEKISAKENLNFIGKQQVVSVVVNDANVDETLNSTYSEARKHARFIAIGGDHSVTYATFKAFAEGKKNPGMVVFDAHADSMHKFSVPTHENFVRQLIEDGILKKENVVLVGSRALDSEEARYLRENKMKIFTMKQIFDNGIENVCDAVMELSREFSELYVSVDIDVLDPAFAPGTGYPEPAGLSSRELLHLLQRIRMMKNYYCADIVEVNPDKDVSNLTVKIAAKIVAELL